jgi:hypothetical protein
VAQLDKLQSKRPSILLNILQNKLRDTHLNQVIGRVRGKPLSRLQNKVPIRKNLFQRRTISKLWNTNIVKVQNRVNQPMYTISRQPSTRAHLTQPLNTVQENHTPVTVQNMSQFLIITNMSNTTAQSVRPICHQNNIVLKNLLIIKVQNLLNIMLVQVKQVIKMKKVLLQRQNIRIIMIMVQSL